MRGRWRERREGRMDEVGRVVVPLPGCLTIQAQNSLSPVGVSAGLGERVVTCLGPRISVNPPCADQPIRGHENKALMPQAVIRARTMPPHQGYSLRMPLHCLLFCSTTTGWELSGALLKPIRALPCICDGSLLLGRRTALKIIHFCHITRSC